MLSLGCGWFHWSSTAEIVCLYMSAVDLESWTIFAQMGVRVVAGWSCELGSKMFGVSPDSKCSVGSEMMAVSGVTRKSILYPIGTQSSMINTGAIRMISGCSSICLITGMWVVYAMRLVVMVLNSLLFSRFCMLSSFCSSSNLSFALVGKGTMANLAPL